LTKVARKPISRGRRAKNKCASAGKKGRESVLCFMQKKERKKVRRAVRQKIKAVRGKRAPVFEREEELCGRGGRPTFFSKGVGKGRPSSAIGREGGEQLIRLSEGERRDSLLYWSLVDRDRRGRKGGNSDFEGGVLRTLSFLYEAARLEGRG